MSAICSLLEDEDFLVQVGDHLDVVVIPPELNELTDEDEQDEQDDTVGIACVVDVPGPIEIHYDALDDSGDVLVEIIEDEPAVNFEHNTATTSNVSSPDR
jgi:hypothetical protein